MKKVIVILIFLFIITNNNIYSDENVIKNYFEKNSFSLYFYGVKDFYRGILFSDKFVNGNFEDKYTELLFIIPIGSEFGICIQVDKNIILDAFLFNYDKGSGKFIQSNAEKGMLFLSHGFKSLNEITNIRFKIISYEQMKAILLQFNIDI